jgi:hypothetical protein
MPPAWQALAMTLPIVFGVAPGNTRRSALRSSGGVVPVISYMTGSGTATHRRAADVFPERARNL